MLIRSQCKNILLPLDRFVIVISKDGSIIAYPTICASPHEAYESVIAKYRTREKALKVLDMIQDNYEALNYVYKSVLCSHVFQMPQDDEV